jgi:hypothetical protein
MIAALLKMMIHPYNMSECVQYFVQREGYTPFVE